MQLVRPFHLQKQAWRLLWPGCMQVGASGCHDNLTPSLDICRVFSCRGLESFLWLLKPEGPVQRVQRTMTRCMPG